MLALFNAACTFLPPVRCLSYANELLAPASVAALELSIGSNNDELKLLPLDGPIDGPPEGIYCDDFTWVHIAKTFKDCAAAKRHGAVTVWLNEKAASNADDYEATGFLGATIIKDFADSLCACEALLPASVLEGMPPENIKSPPEQLSVQPTS